MNRVAIITDLHIKQNGLAYRTDTENNFYDLVAELKGWELDHIICAGDLSAKEALREDCIMVKTELDDLGVPYDVIRGNHDNALDISEVFGYEMQGGEVYFTKRVGDRSYIFLDTNEGTISDQQCEWLELQLQKPEEPFIVMHYPPMDSGIAYIDAKHEFKEPEKLLDILTGVGKRLNIFCGHCHSERLIQYKNLSVFITPSCIAQVDERDTNFKMYHDYVGYRIIEDNGRSLRTFVKYLF
ncbi:metallophosphoesterase family protein [Portibacter marinus]|uniref:metallophosphoesterase family protein n=1 Tax=Portibacter marinus TaxID=2898660 RepID=UPI001F1EC8E9|nr:metallophosphoesterase [Portibacter marinus]